MTTFAQLKKNSKSLTEKLAQALEKTSKPKFEEDNRYWRPTLDKSGNSSTIIRFLPAPEGEDVPFVRYWDHAFKGPTGKWYIEKSRTTLSDADPVSEYNTELWNTGTEDNKNIVRKQKRNLRFVSNIYIVKDPANPDNEGKVFLFRYGKKIFDKLNALMHPEFEDDQPVNPFDLWEGCNLRLKVRKVEGFTNYDSSEFEKPAPISKDDKELEAIWKSEHPLQPIVAPDQFKSYAELKTRLYTVLNLQNSEREDVKESPKMKEAATKKPAPHDDGDDDDDGDFYKKLVEDEVE